MDNLDYKDSVEKLIDETEQNFTVTKTIIIQTTELLDEVKKCDGGCSGTAFITNNQNGMGGIVSPQP